MHIDFYGLGFETPSVTFHLFSPWRSSAIEHRLFEAVRNLRGVEAEQNYDEWRLQLQDPKIWRTALQSVARILKGWQEEADPGSERRSWCWLIEGDTNADGYDHTGEPTSLWAFIRISLERGGPGEPDKCEHIDLEGFSVRISGAQTYE